MNYRLLLLNSHLRWFTRCFFNLISKCSPSCRLLPYSLLWFYYCLLSTIVISPSTIQHHWLLPALDWSWTLTVVYGDTAHGGRGAGHGVVLQGVFAAVVLAFWCVFFYHLHWRKFNEILSILYFQVWIRALWLSKFLNQRLFLLQQRWQSTFLLLRSFLLNHLSSWLQRFSQCILLFKLEITTLDVYRWRFPHLLIDEFR